MKSGVVWLGSSAADIAVARDALRKAQLPGVLDELGFMVLQAAFADRLYPGVNTIMTRARYLVFVAAIYAHLETSGAARGRDVDREARRLQDELRQALAKNESQSVIGVAAGAEIRRPPSNIYWNALIALGIATRSIGEPTYQDELFKGLVGGRASADDDRAVHDDTRESLWDPGFPIGDVFRGDRFPESTSFRLTSREARDLRDRYERLQPGGDMTLLSALVRWSVAQHAGALDIRYPWDAPAAALTAPLRLVVKHARALSVLAAGATLQYWRMLIEKRDEEDPGTNEALERWWTIAEEVLPAWDIDELARVAWSIEHRRPSDIEFVRAWRQRLVAARSARAMLSDRGARELIERREQAMRQGRARIRSRHHLERWRAPSASDLSRGPIYLLTYRHATGIQFVRDILDGLARGAT